MNKQQRIPLLFASMAFGSCLSLVSPALAWYQGGEQVAPVVQPVAYIQALPQDYLPVASIAAVPAPIAPSVIEPAASSNDWRVPVRWGTLAVHEETLDGSSRSVITFDGYILMRAESQPGGLRVSSTFALQDEDAVIVTAYSADTSCRHRNYLLTARRDHTILPPKEINNCGLIHDAHVEKGALMISFPSETNYEGLRAFDMWNFDGYQLRRI